MGVSVTIIINSNKYKQYRHSHEATSTTELNLKNQHNVDNLAHD